jgi:hypothetical protein
MDSRDLWEDQVNRLTKRYAELTQEVEALGARLSYFENVVVKLLMALKEGGIIQPDPDGEHSFD